MHNSPISGPRPEFNPGAREVLSALMDGQAVPRQVDEACTAWRDDEQARQCWHTYHLIGDVLRSDELAGAPGRDQAFLRGLRARLADEPIPLAPAALTSTPPGGVAARGRRRLMAPVAAAAGFVAVAGVLVVMRVSAPAPTAVQATASAKKSSPEVMAVSGELIRDVRLDRYLNAHRQVSNGASVHVPGGVVRSVDTIVLENK